MNLAIFEFETTPVRIFGSADKPMFAASDICRVLGIQNASEAVNGKADRDNDGLDEDEKGVASVYTSAGSREILTITESGMYSLIFKSRKPQAKVFRRWVTGEVLPEIRRKGQYVPPGAGVVGVEELADGMLAYLSVVRVLVGLGAKPDAAALALGKVWGKLVDKAGADALALGRGDEELAALEVALEEYVAAEPVLVMSAAEWAVVLGLKAKRMGRTLGMLAGRCPERVEAVRDRFCRRWRISFAG